MTGYVHIYDVLRVCSTHNRYAVHHVRHALVAKVQLLYAREEMLPAARFYSGDIELKADFCPNYVQEYTLWPGSRFILLLTRLISHWTLPFISHMRASFPPNPHTPLAFCIPFSYCAFSLATKKTFGSCAFFALRIFKFILHLTFKNFACTS
jgi:hypothetical protein